MNGVESHITYNIITMKQIFGLKGWNVLALLGGGALLVGSLVGSLARADAQTVNTQLDFGVHSNEVAKLQSFLAKSGVIYPEGIVSGYYGPLTQKAVMQFQTSYDLPQVGRVGPLTMAKINELITSGLGLDVNAPVITGVTLQTARYGASVTWATNEMANGAVYYDAHPLVATEAAAMRAMPYVSGSVASNVAMGSVQSVMLQNLQPGTTYHYVIRSTDASGNMTFTWPAAFRTQE